MCAQPNLPLLSLLFRSSSDGLGTEHQFNQLWNRQSCYLNAAVDVPSRLERRGHTGYDGKRPEWRHNETEKNVKNHPCFFSPNLSTIALETLGIFWYGARD